MQKVSETKEIEVTEEKAEELINHRLDVVDFIWENMTEQEQQWTQGKAWVDSYVDIGYGGVYK